MLNILIRTSQRKESFKRLISDIVSQTIPKEKLRILVSSDSRESYPDETLKDAGIEYKIIEVEKGTGSGFYNLYLNDLLDAVSDGWIFIVDDDDYIHSNTALEQLYTQLRNKNKIYLFKILLEGIHQIPRKAEFGKDGVVRGQISMSGFSFHSNHKDKCRFKKARGGDYHFVKDMLKHLPISWLNHIVVSTGNRGLKGSMDDKVLNIGKIRYFTPFAMDRNFGRELNEYMEMIGDDDWAVIMDGDIMFLQPDFGQIIHRVIGKYGLGVYSCMTNRVIERQQLYQGKISSNADIRRHKKIADMQFKRYAYKAVPANPTLSGMLFVVPKKIWKEFPFRETGILGVDNDFTDRVAKKYPLYIMQGLYVLHYYRFNEGIKYRDHLK